MKQIEVCPLAVGAEIHGFNPNAPIDDALRQALFDAWMRYGVLVFHGVSSNAAHLALSRCFGELVAHPTPEIRCEDEPLLIELGDDARGAAYVDAYVYDDTDIRIGRLAWHRDTASLPNVCQGAMLRIVETSPDSAETLFADTARAYDDLPDSLKSRIADLEFHATGRRGPFSQSGPGAIWKTVREPTAQEYPQKKSKPEQAGNGTADPGAAVAPPSVIHPAVLVHPGSGRKCLFISPTYVDYFLGLPEDESQSLLDDLVAHMTKPEYVYKHSWSPNDAVIWDNFRCMHAAVGHRPGERRKGYRTTLASNPIGRLPLEA